MAQTATMTFGVPGAAIWIEYQQQTNRIQSANWNIPAGVTVTVKVWDTNIDPDDPIFTRQETGPDEDSQAIPGNYELVEVEEFGETFLDLPDNILFQFNAEVST